jgi:hypothetical protein
MKKVLFALFIAVGLTACGNASTEATTDSTDSTAVDSTAVESTAIAVDSTATVVE